MDNAGSKLRAPPQAGHFHDLDGMRGILAIVVMLFHMGSDGILKAVSAGYFQRSLAPLCVDFFFILSGFVLFLSFAKRQPTFSEYMIKRVRRLMPLLILTTALALCVRPEHFAILETVANFAGVASILGFRSINSPAWSVPFELFVPLAMLVLLDPLTRFSNRRIVILLVLLILGGCVVSIVQANGPDWRHARAIFGLGSGMALARLTQSLPPRQAMPWTVLSLFAFAIVIMEIAPTWPAIAALFYPISALCIYLGSRTQTLLSTAVFQAFGRWSYSIYLLHLPVLIAIIAWSGWGSGSAQTKALAIGLTILLSALSYRYIELPFMQRRTSASTGTADASLRAPLSPDSGN
ncbi:acyltransferase family protein [Sphingomonas alpina]|uniref:Acyltransferase n=1 Tax=Sphingomonas alpina TaxID=653931 RepID=A0A7H0LF29_9SPHN|nr:acyltransferase [Sphingomonas alpina]QNQ08282.1 acyltransferase [Sphingomonas alpina]